MISLTSLLFLSLTHTHTNTCTNVSHGEATNQQVEQEEEIAKPLVQSGKKRI